MNIQKQCGVVSQALLIAIVIGLTIVAVTALLLFGKTDQSEQHQDHAEQPTTDEGKLDSKNVEAEHAESLSFSPQQLAEQGIMLETVDLGTVEQTQLFAAKLLSNLDRQAHVTSMFAGRVETVYANLDQQVKKGQPLALLLSPDLVQQQSALRLAKTDLTLRQQEYQQEKNLSAEGATAQRDFQRATHAFKQAQIAVSEAQSRILALGAKLDSNGRYLLTAPISGVISSKDIMIGEHVQISDQLFVIDEPNQLWVEFAIPVQQNLNIKKNQRIELIGLNAQQRYQAEIQEISSQADEQTGRLQVRAVVLSKADTLRPNVMLNVALATGQSAQVIRVKQQSIQTIEGKSTVFVVKPHGDKFELSPQVVEIGGVSADGQWVEVRQGLTQEQKYVTQGSFILKSELEKGEAAHEH